VTNSGLAYKNFHELYLAVVVAGVTAFIMGLPFLAEKGQPTPASQKKGKRSRQTDDVWLEKSNQKSRCPCRQFGSSKSILCIRRFLILSYGLSYPISSLQSLDT